MHCFSRGKWNHLSFKKNTEFKKNQNLVPTYICVALGLANGTTIHKWHLYISDHFRHLHWLNMDERISFKIALLAYKSIHGLAPAYLSTYCIPVSSLPGRSHLRSAGEWKMLVPRTKTVRLSPQGFFWACPSTWNALPVPLRDFELLVLSK